MKELSTKRLILNKINKEDAEDFFAICGNKEITTTFMMSKADNIKEAESIIDSVVNKYDDENFIFWAIRLIENNRLIGVLLSYENEILELGYAVSKDYQNKGYATEALNEATKYFLNHDKEILLGTFTDNFPSIRVMQKCGYEFLETKLNEFFYEGKRRDIIYYIKKEY